MPSLPRTLIGRVCIPKPFMLRPLFKADIVVATWVPWESTAASESVGSESYPSPSPALLNGTKSKPPSIKAACAQADEVVSGEPESKTATATSFTSPPIVVRTESRPIWANPHWNGHNGSVLKCACSLKSSSKLSFGNCFL